MDMDFLKDALGDDLFAQVSEKLNGNESIRLANVANGSYIPKDKYDLERQNVRAQKQQIDELNKKICELTAQLEEAKQINLFCFSFVSNSQTINRSIHPQSRCLGSGSSRMHQGGW